MQLLFLKTQNHLRARAATGKEEILLRKILSTSPPGTDNLMPLLSYDPKICRNE